MNAGPAGVYPQRKESKTMKIAVLSEPGMPTRGLSLNLSAVLAGQPNVEVDVVDSTAKIGASTTSSPWCAIRILPAWSPTPPGRRS